VADEAQLSWERRAAPFGAAAALGAVVLQIASFVIQTPALKDAPGADDPLRTQRYLVNFHDHSGSVLGSSLAQALSTVLAAGALFYLFRATRARRAELPQVVQWLLVIGPVLFLLAAVVNWVGLKDAADKFTSGDTAAIRAEPTKGQREDAVEFCREERNTSSQACVTRYARREAVAKKLQDDNRSAVGTAGFLGGALALAFSYVVIALNAMRAGLLSRFMGVLGIIVGALTVLPLLPGGASVVQVFWLGGLALLFLGRWPGGRGPAWETGEAEPWPVPEGRGGLFAPRPREEPEPEGQAEPEPVERPASRKRRRKKRR
jgi:hypothetical protein